MGRRLQGTYLATYDKQYRVIIHDTEQAENTDTDFNLMGLNLIWERCEIFDTMMTSRANVSILMDSEATFSLLEDIKEFEEGRFYLEVQYDGPALGGLQRKWYHKIVLNKASLNHNYKPTLTLPSTDGLADLKNVVYDVHPNFGYAAVKDIIAAILSKISVTEFYADTDVLFQMHTNITAQNTGFSLTEFFKMARFANYFTIKKEGVNTAMKCQDVLKEICNRLFLKCYYADGIYTFIGKEGIHDGRDGNFYRYSKTGALVDSYAAIDINQDFFTNNYLLDGGSLNWYGGVRSIKISCSSEHVNKKQAYYIDWVLTGTNTYQAEYKTIGDALSNIDYLLLIKTMVTGIGNADGPPEKVQMYVEIKEKRISTGAETDVSSMYYDIPFAKGNYDNKVDVLAVDYDREIIVRFKMTVVAPTGHNITMTVSTDLTEADTDVNSVYFRSYLTDTKNVLDKDYPALACDEYGSNQVKVAFWDGGATTQKKYAQGWKLNSTETSWYGLEKKMTGHMLKHLRKNREILQKDVNLTPGVSVDFARPFLWDGSKYFIIEGDWNVKDDIFNVAGEKIVAGSATGIQDEDYVPVEVNTTNPFTNVTGRIIQKQPYYRLFENVGPSITLTDYAFPIPPAGKEITLKSMRRSVTVYVGSYKQICYMETPLPSNRPNTIYVNPATAVITFSQTNTKQNVEVVIVDWFEYGISS